MNYDDCGEWIDEAPERDPDQVRDEIIDEAMFCETQEEADRFLKHYSWARRYLPPQFRNEVVSKKPKDGVVNEGWL